MEATNGTFDKGSQGTESPQICDLVHRAVLDKSDSVGQLKVLLLAAIGAFLAALIGFMFMAKYPFKTVQFLGSPAIQVLNECKRIPVGGTVQMVIKFEKFTSAPGLIVRTLVRKRYDPIRKITEMDVLDSSTVVSSRSPGQGISKAFYYLPTNQDIVGHNNVIIFSIYYNIWGFIPRMVQFETEPFDIYPGSDPKDKRSQVEDHHGVIIALKRAGLISY